MLIADRNGMVVGKAWTNPYVTDGLIGLWDGEWNVAGGQHDGSATTWVDISGNNRDAVLSGTYSWGANYWHVESVSGQGLATWPAQNLGSGQTVEFVIDPIAATLYGRIIAEPAYVASPIVYSSNIYTLYMYGYGFDEQHIIADVIPNFNNMEKHLHQIVHPSGGPMKYYIDGILCWTRNTTHDNTGGVGYFANRSSLERGIDADYFTMRRYNRVLTGAELVANRNVDVERFGIRIPYAYEVEWIETDDTNVSDTANGPYIRTAYIPQLDDDFHFRMVQGSYEYGNSLFGSCNGFRSSAFAQYSSEFWYGNKDLYPVIPGLNTISDIEVRGRKIYVNGSQVADGSDATDEPMYAISICGFNNQNRDSSYTAKYKFCGFTAHRNGVKIADYIPVVDWSGVACLYDKVNGGLFYNGRTGVNMGSFTAGPRK